MKPPFIPVRFELTKWQKKKKSHTKRPGCPRVIFSPSFQLSHLLVFSGLKHSEAWVYLGPWAGGQPPAADSRHDAPTSLGRARDHPPAARGRRTASPPTGGRAQAMWACAARSSSAGDHGHPARLQASAMVTARLHLRRLVSDYSSWLRN